MKAVKFKNSMGNDKILNLERVTSVEKAGSQPALQVAFGKEHTHVNFKSIAERDEVFEKISRLFGVED